MAGLTSTGFEIKTLDEVKTEINSLLQEKFGSVNLTDNSVFSQISGIFAEREALLWQALEEVYNSFYPDTATGSSLDGVCQLIGVTRLDATATNVDVLVTGRNQIIVTQNSEATATGINAVFKCDNDILITNESCLSIKINITDTTKPNYRVTINGYLYNSTATTVQNIINELVANINATSHGFTALNINNQLIISSTNNNKLSVYVTDGMLIDLITTSGTFTSSLKGAIDLPSGTLTNIQTPIAGWTNIINLAVGRTGRNLETDNELRIRRAQSLKLAGSATLDAIRARVANITGVKQVTVNENVTNEIVNTLPPHSFEVLVLGDSAEDSEIGKAIWNTKPAGIMSHGDINVIVNDVLGNSQEVKFSRPVKFNIYVDIELTTTALFPSDGLTKIKESVLNQINKLNVGDTVVYQSLYDSVFIVAGITNAVIRIGGTTSNTPPTISSNNIAITNRQIPITDLTKINVYST